VIDEGLGIRPEDQKGLFTPFFETSDQRSREMNTNSHGLGLCIS